MPRRFARLLQHGLRSPFVRSLALFCAVLLVSNLFTPLLLSDGVPAAMAAKKQAPLPTNLKNDKVHPGSVLIALRVPVQTLGNRHVAPVTSGSASDDEVNTLNAILDGLHTSQVKHLFTNIPADKLNAARAKAMAVTGTYVTDFTQVYQIIFDTTINDGDAVNRLATASLVTSAMPDWIFQKPRHESSIAAPRTVAASRAVTPNTAASSLPPNYSYITDGQSYHDAASNNITGALAMLKDKYGVQPGQGEVITNISLGTIDDTSTILENNQRYLEYRGLPKIPVYLSSENCTGPANNQTCSVVLDGQGTNTTNGQGDLGEVMLDFGVMAPPPRGDVRVPNPQTPGQLGEILGEAYGANFRLINPLVNGTPDFFAAWLGGGLLQFPAPTVMTASIGDGAFPGFSGDYFFEEEAMIHDIVTTLVNGADIFVTISAGDGQTDTQSAMNPNGIIGSAEVTTDPNKVVDINSGQFTDPRYSYLLTFEPQYLIDSGANDAGGNTLNDVFNNSPWNKAINPYVSHTQHTTETRWTGQQNFNSGYGSRTNLAAPADDVLYLDQVVDSNDVPVDPISDFPRLVGGTSASSPEIAGAAAIVRQTSKLLGHPLTARQTRDLLMDTGRPNLIPAFDLDKAYIGPVLDLTKAVQALFDKYHVQGKTSFVRMTVAERKAVPFVGAFARSFFTDTPQDPTAGFAVIDLSQGLVPPSSRLNETIGPSGDNLNSPITFGVDAAYLPHNADFHWKLSFNGKDKDVPAEDYDAEQPYLRLLPAEIFGILGLPLTASTDRQIKVTANAGGAEISMKVSFLGQHDLTYSHAIAPSFKPVFRPDGDANDKVTFSYDLRGLRDGNGGTVDGGVLIVSDIDRAVPQAFPDINPDAHGFKKTLTGLTGTMTVSASELPHGVGTYGIALRGSKAGQEVTDSTSTWTPLRYAPQNEQHPLTPKVQALVSGQGGKAPLYYDIVDTEAGGSTKFNVSYDVRAVEGARGAIIEISAPTPNFVPGVFATGNIPDVNNFTNPYGDRFDTGNNFGQPGSVFHVAVKENHGVAALDGTTANLSVPAGACDNTYQVRVFATDAQGKIIGVASNPSVLSYANLSQPVCTGQ